MFILNIKRFVKSPVFMLGIVCYIAVLYMLQPVHQATGIEDISNCTLTTQPFSFLFFMVISYEFFYQAKSCKLDELISASKMGQVKEKCYGFFIFFSLDLILYAVYLMVSMWGTTSVMEVVNMNWFWLLARTFLINHFLLYLFAILIGMLVSFIQSRIKAFVTLVVVFSLFSRILLPIIMRCVDASEIWTHRLDLLGIMNRNYSINCDLFYNYSVESVNYQRILFWILLTLLLICLITNRGKKHIWTGIIMVLTCITLFGYMQPAGYRYTGGDWGVYMEEQQYYMLLYENDRQGIGRLYKDADFKVLKYSGTLSAKRVLDASIDVSVDKDGLEEYCFTLYHGYKIKKVLDENGESLSFEQNGDHVLIKNPITKKVKKIHFEYSGYSRKYVATSQAVFLGGNFPYMPQPGWNVYSTQPVEIHGDPQINMSWDREHELKGLGYEVDFDIWFLTNRRVFSNLSEDEDSHFTGISEGATFVASDFIQEMKARNCILYYSVLCAPYYASTREETKENFEHVIDDIPESKTWDDMKIFDMGVMGDGDPVYYFASDHIIADNDKIRECYPYYRKYGETPTYTDMEETSSMNQKALVEGVQE